MFKLGSWGRFDAGASYRAITLLHSQQELLGSASERELEKNEMNVAGPAVLLGQEAVIV